MAEEDRGLRELTPQEKIESIIYFYIFISSNYDKNNQALKSFFDYIENTRKKGKIKIEYIESAFAIEYAKKQKDPGYESEALSNSDIANLEKMMQALKPSESEIKESSPSTQHTISTPTDHPNASSPKRIKLSDNCNKKKPVTNSTEGKENLNTNTQPHLSAAPSTPKKPLSFRSTLLNKPTEPETAELMLGCNEELDETPTTPSYGM